MVGASKQANDMLANEVWNQEHGVAKPYGLIALVYTVYKHSIWTGMCPVLQTSRPQVQTV